MIYGSLIAAEIQVRSWVKMKDQSARPGFALVVYNSAFVMYYWHDSDNESYGYIGMHQYKSDYL